VPYSLRNGLRIHYETHGDGPAMVLIHANPFDRRLWQYQVARFSPFFRVIAVDLRGYGLSDKPETPFTLHDMMEDVLGVCADEGVSQAIFAGVSVGSGISLLAALERPAMVRAAILVGGSSSGPRNVEALVSGFAQQDLASYLLSLMRGYVAPEFAASALGDYLLRRFVENAQDLSAVSIAHIFRARGSCDMSGRLKDLSVPVLVINGALDKSLPAGRLTAQGAPGAEHVVIDDAGHACCIEKPEAFEAAMIDFLGRRDLLPAGLSAPLT
jgi:pimeloyl-ACP methyl ester carboxylesterase